MRRPAYLDSNVRRPVIQLADFADTGRRTSDVGKQTTRPAAAGSHPPHTRLSIQRVALRPCQYVCQFSLLACIVRRSNTSGQAKLAPDRTEYARGESRHARAAIGRLRAPFETPGMTAALLVGGSLAARHLAVKRTRRQAAHSSPPLANDIPRCDTEGVSLDRPVVTELTALFGSQPAM